MTSAPAQAATALTDHLAADLAEFGLPLLDPAAALRTEAGPAAVLLTDWTLDTAAELSRHALSPRTPDPNTPGRPAPGHALRLIPLRLDGALAVVGPVLRPGAAACLRCGEYQRLATTGGRVPFQSAGLSLAGVGAPALLAPLASLVADLLATDLPVADPVAAEPMTDDRNQNLSSQLSTPSSPLPPTATATATATTATVHLLHTGRATWSTHQVRPIGGCPVCRPLPADTAAAARLSTRPRPLPVPGVLRGPNLRTSNAQLRAALHDERFGPVRQLIQAESSVAGLTTALLTDGRVGASGGHGRGSDFESSERVALFEGVERLLGMRPHGRRTVLRSAFATLGPRRAVDPERLGLPDPAYDGHPASSTVPYHPELELDWVHGWSLTRRRALAVPEHVAYWDPPEPDRPRVVYESSNGCGLGNSPEEAALYGLFEVAERDAFLMAWYAGAPLPRLAVPEDDPEVGRLADRAELAGYRLSLLDATNDLGVPAVLALCRLRTGHPLPPHPLLPHTLLAAGAHHDPRAAVRSAVSEVVTNVQEAVQRLHTGDRPLDPERLRPMLAEPELVRSLDDHTGVNGLAQAQSRLAFLFADAPRSTLLARPAAPVTDLTVLLEATVGRLAGLGLEVITVDQDEAGVRDRLGLHCAKVIVPGSLPMTFGHVHRRTRGLPRLLEVPYRLGRTSRPLRPEELNPHPHPFP
ncbi:TOMM precursor leader peptide-binding protein [Kitasatospora sp. NBC_01287]|uniref:TOMM precursor leader peptide-binding protein n=1 Tax=Kitasatospora sp. NBC_01287 TaxID=2903573 RepID=UPI002250163C|nr:TOMM precursor leader peptide-binding protein [Kitasatospora sp. NBC_01287]MCX4745876.1 TOMM precursor leader peptide-binding protein [Kitasatospora sp. NBC_01287]